LATALRQVSAAPGSPAAATAISALLRPAATPADFAAAARLFKDDIAALQSAPDQAAAVRFARASLINGDVQLAQRWAASARQAGAAETVLGPVDAAAAAMEDLSGQQGAMAMHRRIDAAGAGAANLRAAARDVVILAALGAPMDETTQGFLLANAPQGGASADAGVLLALAAAVERGAVGEGALLAAIAGGDAGPARLDADSLGRVIRALRALRLEDDARRFAVEALVAGAPS
jgi:hypothetical protein